MINFYKAVFFSTGFSFEFSFLAGMMEIKVYGSRGGFLGVVRLREEDADKLVGALLDAQIAMQDVEEE